MKAGDIRQWTGPAAAVPAGLRRSARWGWAVVAVVAGLALAPAAEARWFEGWRARPAPAEAQDGVALAELPADARATHARVLAGGPFFYEKDGSVFGNREGLLPRQPRGYYREYTVVARKRASRGAKRLVCGGEPPQQPEVCYYSADHYASFVRVLTPPARAAAQP